ncbi:hypothetical protein H4R33_000131 [Dimargaris cristalligena]|uniref:Uncharacterized protein n=1 Tax=Dimargaris cristalligena TaxID=215637 RepID=A0A4Q0A4D3_9FUNG|nr:hypothetical protein H4R33_000131 [Dimargaris cristalligena]RKP40262.1 hypothetical protein BJ085DRAFT_39729 [Dimargaris cristalligena]|eukprot:RKP40262.1 hypothetical protein BJ085DRAFT_39729 [Dimargaris cristalligena]
MASPTPRQPGHSSSGTGTNFAEDFVAGLDQTKAQSRTNEVRPEDFADPWKDPTPAPAATLATTEAGETPFADAKPILPQSFRTDLIKLKRDDPPLYFRMISIHAEEHCFDHVMTRNNCLKNAKVWEQWKCQLLEKNYIECYEQSMKQIKHEIGETGPFK